MDIHFNSSFEEIICSFLEKTILQKNKPLKPYHGSMDISIHIGYHRLIHYMKDVYAIYSDKHRATNIYNDKIPLECIEKHIEYIDWDWGFNGLSRNEFITVEFVEKHLDKPWQWGEYGLSSNPNMTMKFIERHMDKPWDYGKYGLSSNLCITTEFVNRYRHKLWCWNILAENPSISIDTFNQFIHYPELDRGIHIFQGLSKNPEIKSEFIEEYIHEYWNFKTLSINPVITDEFVELHPNKPWNYWYGLSGNPSISLEYVEQHQDKDWNLAKLSSHSDLTMVFIESHLDKYWNWERGGLSSHPNITTEFIERNHDKPWDWGLSGLLSNPFTQEYYKIQSKIKRAYYKNEVINVLYHIIKGISIEHLSNIIITFSV